MGLAGVGTQTPEDSVAGDVSRINWGWRLSLEDVEADDGL